MCMTEDLLLLNHVIELTISDFYPSGRNESFSQTLLTPEFYGYVLPLLT